MNLGMTKARFSAHCHVEFCPMQLKKQQMERQRWETKGSCFEQQFHSSVCFPSAQISY